MAMTPEEVRALVQEISDCRKDDEAAHRIEDALYHRIIRELALIGEASVLFTFFDLSELVNCARIALETEDMGFSHWCA